MSNTKRAIEILLVEDNAADARLAAEGFKLCKINNNLHIAKDGVEALNFLGRKDAHADAPTPDLILLDLNMPRMDGREALEKIKSDEGYKLIPVVIMTTSREEKDILTSYASHANCYIRKPLDVAGLLDVVKIIERFWFETVSLPSLR